MWKKAAKLITNNFGLKVLAVVFAIILWLVIVNTQDPDKTVTFTVPVEIVNAEYLADEGKTFEVIDNTESISFTVNGKRSIVENLTADDFMAVANMENIDETMSMVPITLTPTSYSSQLDITRRQSYLMVSVEDLVSREFKIQVDVSGTPARMYFVESTEVSPDIVTVEGPESVVSEIAYAQTSINVNGAEETFSLEEDVLLMNENGNAVDTGRLNVDVTETEVTANILFSKEVSVSFEMTGMPADGYWFEDPVCDVDSLTIAGEQGVLEQIEEITITAPELSVDGASEDVIVSVSVEDSLPEGVALYDEEAAELTVTLPIVPADSIEVTVPAENITVIGLADDLFLTMDEDSLTATVMGLEETIRDVEGDTLFGTLDASDLDVGSYSVTITLDTDGTYRAVATCPVSIVRIERPGDNSQDAV